MCHTISNCSNLLLINQFIWLNIYFLIYATLILQAVQMQAQPLCLSKHVQDVTA